MIRRLSLLWKRFTPLELRLLAEVGNVLPKDAQPLFDAQVAAINHVQRLPPSWSQIDFYRRPNRTGIPLVPCTDEFRLAEVTITPGPKAVAFEAWDGRATAALLGDPLRAATGSREPEDIPAVWQGVLLRHAGEQPAGWVLYDASTAYRVVVNDAEYLILAEREGPEFVLYRIEPRGERLYYLKDHHAVPQALDQIERVM